MIDGHTYPNDWFKLNELLLWKPWIFEWYSDEYLEANLYKDSLYYKHSRHLPSLLSESQRRELLNFAMNFYNWQIGDILSSWSPKDFLRKSASHIASFRKGEKTYIRDTVSCNVKRITSYVWPFWNTCEVSNASL